MGRRERGRTAALPPSESRLFPAVAPATVAAMEVELAPSDAARPLGSLQRSLSLPHVVCNKLYNDDKEAYAATAEEDSGVANLSVRENSSVDGHSLCPSLLGEVQSAASRKSSKKKPSAKGVVEGDFASGASGVMLASEPQSSAHSEVNQEVQHTSESAPPSSESGYAFCNRGWARTRL